MGLWLTVTDCYMQDALPNRASMASPGDPQVNETSTGTYLGSGTHNACLHDDIPRNLRQRNRNAIATIVQTLQKNAQTRHRRRAHPTETCGIFTQGFLFPRRASKSLGPPQAPFLWEPLRARRTRTRVRRRTPDDKNRAPVEYKVKTENSEFDSSKTPPGGPISNPATTKICSTDVQAIP